MYTRLGEYWIFVSSMSSVLLGELIKAVVDVTLKFPWDASEML